MVTSTWDWSPTLRGRPWLRAQLGAARAGNRPRQEPRPTYRKRRAPRVANPVVGDGNTMREQLLRT
jgi:hypothetical protein